MLSEKLKSHTSLSHAQLERLLIGRIKNINVAQDYIKLLTLFYAYFGALEARINFLPMQDIIIDYSSRRKTASLLKDLAYFGSLQPPLATDKDLPELKNKIQALGALYVIEGSTLGGVVISKMIAVRLKFTDIGGLSFFTSYGAEIPKMWGEFKDCLNALHLNEDETEQLLIAAEETFIGFKNWILKNEGK